MYTRTNFMSKKALKEAVAAGDVVKVYQPGPFYGATNGRVTLEGPHFPKAHKWYATAEIKDSWIVKGTVK